MLTFFIFPPSPSPPSPFFLKNSLSSQSYLTLFSREPRVPSFVAQWNDVRAGVLEIRRRTTSMVSRISSSNIAPPAIALPSAANAFSICMSAIADSLRPPTPPKASTLHTLHTLHTHTLSHYLSAYGMAEDGVCTVMRSNHMDLSDGSQDISDGETLSRVSSRYLANRQAQMTNEQHVPICATASNPTTPGSDLTARQHHIAFLLKHLPRRAAMAPAIPFPPNRFTSFACSQSSEATNSFRHYVATSQAAASSHNMCSLPFDLQLDISDMHTCELVSDSAVPAITTSEDIVFGELRSAASRFVFVCMGCVLHNCCFL